MNVVKLACDQPAVVSPFGQSAHRCPAHACHRRGYAGYLVDLHEHIMPASRSAPGAGLGTMLQDVPFQCSVSVPPPTGLVAPMYRVLARAALFAARVTGVARAVGAGRWLAG